MFSNEMINTRAFKVPNMRAVSLNNREYKLF